MEAQLISSVIIGVIKEMNRLNKAVTGVDDRGSEFIKFR